MGISAYAIEIEFRKKFKKFDKKLEKIPGFLSF